MKKITEHQANIIGMNMYVKGILEGLELYAFWKNGVQYVGAGLTTLETAREDILETYKDKLS